MQASKWTEMAPLPDVAAAHIEVPSAPVKSEKMPSIDLSFKSDKDEPAISEALVPYAATSCGVAGTRPSKSAPSFRAVT